MQNLKNLRKERKISSYQLAKAVNISQPLLSNYELGKTNPPINAIIKLADYFGCSVDYLLGHQTNNILQLELLTPAQREVFDLLKTLNDREAYSLIGYINHMRGSSLADVVDKILENKK